MRVLVIADNLLVRTGLGALLAMQTEIEVIGQIAGGENLADELDLYHPDAVIYDLGYDLAAVPRLSTLTDVPVVALLSNSDTASAAVAALGSGAYGLLLRDNPPEKLATALNAALNGLIVFDPILASALIVPDTSVLDTLPLTETLTRRESEVLQLLAEGLPNKLIAQRLAISPNTVKFHINAILSKLGVQSRTEAVIRATRLGLVIL